jgi:uncharacterized membrane protein YhaH (DUF805 family)
MTMGEAIRSMYGNYANFSGRAPRSAFWWVVLALLIAEAVMMAPMFLSMQPGPDGMPMQPGGLAVGLLGLFGLLMLATLVPYFALIVRRLHDVDKSGWFFLIYFIPLVGPIVFIVFMAKRGTEGPNRFGPNPYSDAQVF